MCQSLYEFTPLEVPLDHLCPPQAHWQTPPKNSILAPPLSPGQTLHSSSGDRAVALTWPDYAVSSSGEEAAELACPLPAQSLLTPEAFCMKFYQVR